MPAKLKAKEEKAKGKNNLDSASKDKKAASKSVSKSSVKPVKKPEPKQEPEPKKVVKREPKVLAKRASPKSSPPVDDKSSKAKSANKKAKDTSVVKQEPVKSKAKTNSPKRDAPVGGTSPADDPLPVKKTKSEDKIVTVVTKGGAAVDLLVPNKQKFRVYQQAGQIYSCTMNQSNVDHNNNKFYIVQVLLEEASNAFYVWTRWGRVGVPGMNANKGPWGKDAALKEYHSKVNDKQKGGYVSIEIKYEDKDDKKEVNKADTSKPKKDVASKMDAGLQRLISLIFDVNVMNNAMKEIGYDATRMPLGKLGETTIKQAYEVLTKLSTVIKANNTQQIRNLSSQFYSLIPHDFGYKNMSNFVLDNDQKVKSKVRMLETISDLKITTKLLDQEGQQDASVLDQNYAKLGCTISTMDQSSPEYKLIKEYFDNTKASYSKVEIGQVYEVVRPTEQKAFNEKIGNNMLLWHGSRVSNFVGILSQGLRIAPPEAPVSGYLFGKGIYLADMAEKSINYCRSHGSDTALMLLIEGAIGNPNILLQSNCQAKQLMQKAKKDSTKCHGSKAPPESSYTKLHSFVVPKGKPVPTGSGSYMGHNEFIVYNMNQARIRYVIRMDMKGQ